MIHKFLLLHNFFVCRAARDRDLPPPVLPAALAGSLLRTRRFPLPVTGTRALRSATGAALVPVPGPGRALAAQHLPEQAADNRPRSSRAGESLVRRLDQERGHGLGQDRGQGRGLGLDRELGREIDQEAVLDQGRDAVPGPAVDR